MEIKFSLVDHGLESAIDVVKRSLQVGQRFVGLGERSPFAEVEIDSLSTSGANHIRIALKPSKRLVELVTATGTVEVGKMLK